MLWARLLAYVTGTVNQELLLRNEYVAAENRILRGQIKGRLLLLEGEKAALAEIAHLTFATTPQGLHSGSRHNVTGHFEPRFEALTRNRQEGRPATLLFSKLTGV